MISEGDFEGAKRMNASAVVAALAL